MCFSIIVSCWELFLVPTLLHKYHVPVFEPYTYYYVNHFYYHLYIQPSVAAAVIFCQYDITNGNNLCTSGCMVDPPQLAFC